jgi:hypothetical protein
LEVFHGAIFLNPFERANATFARFFVFDVDPHASCDFDGMKAGLKNLSDFCNYLSCMKNSSARSPMVL